MKTVLITGGTGFIGRHLVTALQADGWQVTVLTRDPQRATAELADGVQAVSTLDGLDAPEAIVNLAGENLAAGRWTDKRKHEMLDSRLRVTRTLVSFIERCKQPPAVLVTGSAVGYYGARGDDVLTESEPAGDEFQSDLCSEWEEAAMAAERRGVRVCRIRTGIVLGANDGALAQMITPFRFGLGGHFGSGRQYMPWIHIRDEVNAIRFLIAHEACRGAFNLTAPDPVTNREFTRTLARVLKRPSVAWVPAPVLKLMVGEMAHLLLTGQRAVPAALQDAGFTFAFERLETALADLLDGASDRTPR